MNHFASRARYWLLFALIVAMPLSFSPSVALPLFNFPSFRIGLYQIVSILFVLVSIPLLVKYAPRFIRNRWFVLGASLLLVSLFVGLLTTLTPARTILYSASLMALIVLGCAGYVTWRELRKRSRARLQNGLLWSGIIFGVLALLQLAIASLDRSAFGTLCTGCSDAVFGFPRINLFAAEPQFFANSLLPVFFAGLLLRNNRRLANWSLAVSSLAIALTFSRGAFLAVAGGIVVYALILILQRQSLRQLAPLGIAALGASAGFVLLVGSATLRYQDTPYITHNTIVSMIDHLSLGRIHIPQKTVEVPVVANTPNTEETTGFTPEGFVEASSNDRLSAAQLALQAWGSSPRTVLFGVGMGNLGAYVNAHIQPAPTNLTVYMFYVLVLAELGIIGLIVLVGTLCFIVYRGIRGTSTLHIYAALTTVAFAIQFVTFGSYINVMYIYLLLGMFIAVTRPTTALPQE